MSNIQIPNLPAAITLNGTEQLEGVQAGTSVKLTVAQLGAYITAQYPAPGVSSIATNAPITGGTITTSGTIGLAGAGVTNYYLATMSAGTVKANVTGGSAQPTDATPSVVLDLIGSARGSILYRGASGWATLPPGAPASVLLTGGTGTDPVWGSAGSVGISMTVGATPIANGTTTRVLYDNAGTLGEYAQVPVAVGGTGAATSDAAAVNLSNAYSVANITALKNLTTRPPVVVTQGYAAANDGGGGVWQFQSGDQSTNVTNDTRSGVWAAPASAPTGASGAWKRVYSGNYAANWFGIFAAAADNATALQAAVNYISYAGGGVLQFLAGNFTINSQILWRDGVFAVGEKNKTVLDWSQKGYFSNSEGFLLAKDGSLGTAVTVTSDVPAGAVAIPVSSISGFAPNDFVLIWSTEVLWSEATNGEIAHVQWADSGYIYLKMPLSFTYSTSGYTVRVQKINSHTGGLRDLKIKGAGINPAGLPSPTYTGTPSEVLPGADRGDLGVEVRFGKDWLIDNVTFEGVEYRAATFFMSINTKVTNSTIYFDSINQLSQYGVSVFGGNINTLVDGCTFYNGRHHFTTLSSASISDDRNYVRGMPTNIVISNNKSFGCWVYALDTHRAGSEITFSGNVIKSLSGGIEIRTPNTSIVGNVIEVPYNDGSILGIAAAHGIASYYNNTNIAITANNIFGGYVGIFVSSPTTTSDNIAITGNTISNTVHTPISILGPATKFVIANNTIGEPSGTVTGGITLYDCKHGAITGNVIVRDNAYTCYGIYIAGLAAPGDCDDIVISGNTVTKLGAGAVTGIVLNNNVTNTGLGVNSLASCTTPFSLGTGAGNYANKLYVGTTSLSNGTSGRVLYNNAGALGEMTTTGTGTQLVLSAAPTLSGLTRLNGTLGLNAAATTYYGIYNNSTLTGSVNSAANISTPTIADDVITSAVVFRSSPSTAASAFTLGTLNHFYATGVTIGAGSSITNQYAFRVDSTATGATNNYAYWSGLAAGGGNYAFYAGGTAPSVFNGVVTFTTYTKMTPTAVASLTAAATAGAGARAFVTDATATTFASVVAGGGANNVPVYCDGTDWRIG